jgi:DNA topoisomerase-3
MITTWICEKYSIANTLAKAVLGGNIAHKPPMIKTGAGDIIIYTSGSIVENADPDAYDPAFKSWTHADVARLVARGFKTQATKDRTGKPRFQDLGTMMDIMKTTDVAIIATDAGREGEVIAWRLLEHCHFKGVIKRMWTSSMMPSGLQKAAQNLLPPEIKKPLFHAGLARGAVDWIEGLTGTRLMTRRHSGQGDHFLSVGRVQTPLVALINDRCLEIETFVPRRYWVLVASVTTAKGAIRMTHTRPPERQFTDEAEATAAAMHAIGQSTPLSTKTIPKAKPPPNFATTPDIQQAAFKKHKLTPEQTLSIMQELYEAGLITYPRTECAYLDEIYIDLMPVKLRESLIIPSIKSVLDQNPDWLKSPVIRKDRYDDAKVQDHGAIVPDKTIVHPNTLSADQAKVYELIIRRSIACLLPDHEWEATRITGTIDGNEYVATGRIITNIGWKAVDVADEQDIKSARRKTQAQTSDDEDQNLPQIASGDVGTFDTVKADGRDTKPPPYYDQASIIDAMINLDLHLADPRAKAAMISESGQKKGLGTGATRANAIALVQSRGYVDASSGNMVITPRGRDFITIVRSELPWLADPLHTVRQEIALQEIEEKSRDHLAYIEQARRHMSTITAHLQNLPATGQVSKIDWATPLGQKPKTPSATHPSPAITRSRTQPARHPTAGGPRPPKSPSGYPVSPTEQKANKTTYAPTPPPSAAKITMKTAYFSVPASLLMKARQIGLQVDPINQKFFASTSEKAAAARKVFKEILP